MWKLIIFRPCFCMRKRRKGSWKIESFSLARHCSCRKAGRSCNSLDTSRDFRCKTFSPPRTPFCLLFSAASLTSCSVHFILGRRETFDDSKWEETTMSDMIRRRIRELFNSFSRFVLQFSVVCGAIKFLKLWDFYSKSQIFRMRPMLRD